MYIILLTIIVISIKMVNVTILLQLTNSLLLCVVFFRDNKVQAQEIRELRDQLAAETAFSVSDVTI